MNDKTTLQPSTPGAARRPRPWAGFRSGARLAISMALFAVGTTAAVPAEAASTATCGGRAATVVGTPGDDNINLARLGPGPHVLLAGPGNDRIVGSRSGDLICAGSGDDVIRAGAGNDSIWAGPGDDIVHGEGGRDTIIGGAGADHLLGGPGNDRLVGNAGNDRLVGEDGDDRLIGNAGNDQLNGSRGDDDEFTDEVLEIIFDTDMGPDIDDPLALAMLHTYEKRQMIKLSAVTISRNAPIAARYVDAVNTFYRRPDIPIGYYRGTTKLDGLDRYTRPVALSGKYPHDVHRSHIPDGYRVMLQALREADDNSVVIVQVGFSGNVARLLENPEGRNLIRRKVKFLSVMAGDNSGRHVEFNIANDLASAKTVFARWPGQILQSEWGLGYNTLFPGSSIQRRLNYVANHPIQDSYNHQILGWHQVVGGTYNMRSWDLTSVLAAVENPNGYFRLGPRGVIRLDAAGRSGFTANADGKHRSLGSSAGADQARIRARMVELVVERP